MIHNSKLSPSDLPEQRTNKLFQVSLLQGLTNGDYYGSVTIRELRHHGDTGIGTFDGLNGELIMLDGTVYRAAGNGAIEAVSDEETTPFAVTAFMTGDTREHLRQIPDSDALYSQLDQMVEARGKNRFYMIRIDGMFRSIQLRSVHAQQEPYRRLVEVLSREQTIFDYEQIEGTMVGLYCPFYMSSLNAAGWHLHFISGDKTRGGHVLGVHIADAAVTWAHIDTFEVRLPQNQMFDTFDLTIDQSKDIEKVEKNR